MNTRFLQRAVGAEGERSTIIGLYSPAGSEGSSIDMNSLFKSKFFFALLLTVAAVMMPAAVFAKDLGVQVVYDSSTFRIDPGFGPNVDFNGARFVVFGRLYKAGTFANCDNGCEFVDGQPDPDYIGVVTCSGWFITSAVNPIFAALGAPQPDFDSAVAQVVANHPGVPFVRATGTYDFGATLDAAGNIHGTGTNMLITDGYLGIPDVVNNSSLITYRPITGGVGTFKGLMLSGATGASDATVLGFFQNGSRLLTENVVFHLK